MRLFLAAWPDLAVVEALRRLPRPERSGVRWTNEQQWHLTLRFLGAVDDGDVPALEESLRGGLADVAGSDAVLGPATACFGRAVLMVPVSGLDALAETVTGATASFGEPPDPRPFHGHLTLARAKRGSDLRRLGGQPVSGSWAVSELTLVRSHTDRTGARYEVLSRISLDHPPSNACSQLR